MLADGAPPSATMEKILEPSTDLTDAPLPMLASLPAPNEPVPLKAGTFKVEFAEQGLCLEADLVGELAWRRKPGPRFELVIRSFPSGLFRPRFCTVLDVDGSRVECVVVNVNISRRFGDEPVLRCELRLRGTTDFGDPSRMRRVTFGLVNFGQYIGSFLRADDGGGWAGRLVLEGGGWRCTLDARRDLGEVVKQLGREGGFAITHAGCLERVDSSDFSAAEMQAVLDALYVLLSFARGHSVSFVMLRGEDDAGALRWWRWFIPSVDDWSDPVTWFDEQRPHQLSPIFETLVTRSTDPGWRDAVQLAVYWYVLSLQTTSTSDAAVVLAFTGLDLVGWFRLVELEKAHSSSAFDKLDAAERLRRLLVHISADAQMPAGLLRLAQHAATEGWADGPAALAVLRNSAVHPKRRAKIFDAPDPVRWDACTLATWYLELALLALLDHRGVYINRIEHLTNHGLEYVPWATADDMRSDE